MMTNERRVSAVIVLLWAVGLMAIVPRIVSAQAANKPEKLHIVVIAGEDAVNVIQQRTAVAPIVEVRDQNNQPVVGAIVRFTVRGKNATFGGVSTVNTTTNAVGQATVSQVTPTASGALRIEVVATSQGQTATATVTQTNYATASQAASASKPPQGGQTGKIVTLSAVGPAAASGAYVYMHKEDKALQPSVTGLAAVPRDGIVNLTRIDVWMNDSTWEPGRTTFTIEWGDGEVFKGPSLDTGDYPLHVYRTTGDHRIRLTIADKSGLQASAETAVMIRDMTGRWVSSAGALNLVQSGTTLNGTYVAASGSVTGAVSGRMVAPPNTTQLEVHLTITPGGTAAAFDFNGLTNDINSFVGTFTTSSVNLNFRRQ